MAICAVQKMTAVTVLLSEMLRANHRPWVSSDVDLQANLVLGASWKFFDCQPLFNDQVPTDPAGNKKPGWSDPLGLDS